MRRRRRPPAPNACRVKGCGRTIPGWQRICTPCFRLLPFNRRQEIAEAGQAKAPHIVARLTLDAIRWLDDRAASAAAAAAAETARRMGERDG